MDEQTPARKKFLFYFFSPLKQVNYDTLYSLLRMLQHAGYDFYGASGTTVHTIMKLGFPCRDFARKESLPETLADFDMAFIDIIEADSGGYRPLDTKSKLNGRLREVAMLRYRSPDDILLVSLIQLRDLEKWMSHDENTDRDIHDYCRSVMCPDTRRRLERANESTDIPLDLTIGRERDEKRA